MVTQLDGSTAVDETRGNWIRTNSGGRFYLQDARAEDVHIQDIAHALSQICRFTGHTSRFYSVAEHSVRVSWLVEPRHALWGLLHDAAEAYIGDVSRPLKHAAGMEGYGTIEVDVERAVRDAFGVVLTPTMNADVKRADLQMLCVEARQLLGISDFKEAGWAYWTEPDPSLSVQGWSPQVARSRFLSRFMELATCR